MKSKVTLVVRILLGLLFVASGIAGLSGAIQPPDNLPEKLKTFNAGMEASVYLMPLVKSLEVICGILLITGMFVPLALVTLAPIVLNIFLVHAFMAPEGLILAVIIGAALIYLSFFAEPYKATIKPIFRRK